MQLRGKTLYNPNRAILRGAAWFSFGLVVSLVAAWLHAWRAPLQPQTQVMSVGGVQTPAARYALRSEESLFVDWYAMLGGERPVYVESAGWPLRCWNTWYRQHSGGSWKLIAGIPLGRPRPSAVAAIAPPWALPLVPAGGPTFLSASIFAALGWLSWHGFRLVRARSRCKKGLCAACGYGPYSPATQCPECGASLTKMHA